MPIAAPPSDPFGSWNHPRSMSSVQARDLRVVDRHAVAAVAPGVGGVVAGDVDRLDAGDVLDVGDVGRVDDGEDLGEAGVHAGAVEGRAAALARPPR
jgi:hypothetical protein